MAIAGRMSDEPDLHERARDAIRAGRLPNRRPERMWGGPSVGADCAICGLAVMPAELEFEIEFVRNGGDPGVDRYNVHIRCFTAWESEILPPSPQPAVHPEAAS